MRELVETFLNPQVLRSAWPSILAGLSVTLRLAAAILPTGLALGLALAALRTIPSRVVKLPIVVFADVFRSVPPLVILIFIYFALPYLEVSLSGFAAAWLGLSLVLAAFAEEIGWAAITAVPEGQWEAARSTGMSRALTLRHVILPQAVRMAIAPLTNRAVAIGKSTALASVIAVPEILNQATSLQAQTANPSPLTLAALAYVLLFLPLVALSRWVESRYRSPL